MKRHKKLIVLIVSGDMGRETGMTIKEDFNTSVLCFHFKSTKNAESTHDKVLSVVNLDGECLLC